MIGVELGEVLGIAKVISDCGGCIDEACCRRRTRRNNTRRPMDMARADPKLAAMAIVLDSGIVRWWVDCADISVGMTKMVVVASMSKVMS